MLQLENSSPFAASIMVFPDQAGVDTLYVVVKGTFALHPRLAVADEQDPVCLADEYWGEPGQSSLKRASEAHLEKPGTDVFVVAEACAPNEQPAAHVDVAVQVAGRTKSARVFGDRVWARGLTGVQPSSPQPFLRMPLVYERAFGGMYVANPDKNQVMAEPQNPVGQGFLGKRSRNELVGHLVPNIDDIRDPIGSPENKRQVLGFGPICGNWQPRLEFAGTYDEKWEKTRAPYVPHDFDPRFFNAAPPDWVFPAGLRGGETVVTVGMSPRGRQQFMLPSCDLEVEVRIRGRTERPATRLETVLLEPTNDRVMLTWRAAVPCDKQKLRIELVEVAATRVELA